jgi:NAD(P)H-hydrate epimerase
MIALPPVFDRDAARRSEARAIGACAADDVLMRRAGLAAWCEVLAHWPGAQRIVVVCGPGDNGGDGYVLARHAHDAGRRVTVLVVQPAHSSLAMRMHDEARAAGVPMQAMQADAAAVLDEADLIVDAMLGLGLSRAPETALACAIETINASGRPVLALDVPSGVDAATGHVPGVAVRATRTLQLLLRHVGTVTGAALDHVGAVGFDALQAHEPVETPSAELLAPADLAAWLPPRARNAHKGRHGRVACIAGNTGMGGAGLLAAEAALRVGAGRVQWFTRERAHVSAALVRCPALMAEVRDADAAAAALVVDVGVIGPGLGRDAWAEAWLQLALRAGVPLVLDADALNLLAAAPAALPAGSVLTPHPGEAARLLAGTVAEVQADRLAAARRIAERFDAAVVLKGAGTVVAAPGRVPRIVQAGNPGMAVAGMGDVLAGVVAGLRAQGFDAFDAASVGALLHAHAGDLAAADGGERGLLPQDLFALLRRATNPVR